MTKYAADLFEQAQIIEADDGAVPEEHILTMFIIATNALRLKGYTFSCEKYIIVGQPNTNMRSKTVDFSGNA